MTDAPDDTRPWVAIGDVHGRADLLAVMLDAIERDFREPRVVLLGDLVDRGPDVRGAIALAREVPHRFPGSHVLLGNHEDWLLRSVDGDAEARGDWLLWGGEATCRAFGVDPRRDRGRLAEAFEPHADALDFLRARPRLIEGFGAASDYLFVHAGVDPTASLAEQDDRDLIWMREPFLSWPRALERTIVHGHTVSELPQVRAHRIGIDTGAVFQGLLSAVVIDAGAPPRFLGARAGRGVLGLEPDRA